MTTFVLDASIALSWCFPDETNEYAKGVFERLSVEQATVPAIWPFEVTNGLVVGIRRGRIGEMQARDAADLMLALGVQVDGFAHRAFRAVRDLAIAHGLSVYDASYIELAHRRELPMASADQKLRTVAQALAISLI